MTQLINEAKRLQELAGINEVKISPNIPITPELEDYVSGLFNMSVMEEEGPQSGIWEQDEYTDEYAYDEVDAEMFFGLQKHLRVNGGKYTLKGNPDINLSLLPNGDIKWDANITFD
jgi:hypothetical protein